MSAIADILLVIVAFIGEMLLWSFVGFYKMCRGLVLKTEREDLRRKWSKGPKEKAVLILGGLIWVPVFAVGFGVGLPLAYNVIRDSMKEKEEIELDLDGVAEFRMPIPKTKIQKL